VKVLNDSDPDIGSPKGKDANDLVLKEMERLFDSVIDDFKSLTGRAGTILSILISVIVAILTIVTLLARPPYWVPLVPAVPLIVAVITSCLVFLGSKVVIAPTSASLVGLTDQPEAVATSVLIRSYQKMLEGGGGEYVEGRIRSHPQKKFKGNLWLLRRKQLLFEWSVGLLAVTLVLLVGMSLALYWV